MRLTTHKSIYQEFQGPQNQNQDICADLDFDSIISRANLKSFAKGRYIYHSLRQNYKLYLIGKGKIKLGYYSENGREVISDVLGARSLFGNVLGEPSSSGQFAQALSEVDVYIINRSDFLEWLRQRPAHVEKIFQVINRRFGQLEQKYLGIVMMDVKNRIIEFLKDFAQAHGQQKGHHITIPNFLTHQEIAEINGTSRQTVTSVFIELKKQKLIDYDRSQIKIFPNLFQVKISHR
ncbi:MAG: Crp/Fnr family transcriptional regulator [Bacteroidia bacterium]|nr:Crp/Fnr family transcriptional regulator [Bacteroidia bacterium]